MFELFVASATFRSRAVARERSTRPRAVKSSAFCTSQHDARDTGAIVWKAAQELCTRRVQELCTRRARAARLNSCHVVAATATSPTDNSLSPLPALILKEGGEEEPEAFSNLLAKATELRINLNIDGAPISARAPTHPSHSQTFLPLYTSLSVDTTFPRSTVACVCETLTGAHGTERRKDSAQIMSLLFLCLPNTFCCFCALHTYGFFRGPLLNWQCLYNLIHLVIKLFVLILLNRLLHLLMELLILILLNDMLHLRTPIRVIFRRVSVDAQLSLVFLLFAVHKVITL